MRLVRNFWNDSSICRIPACFPVVQTFVARKRRFRKLRAADMSLRPLLICHTLENCRKSPPEIDESFKDLCESSLLGGSALDVKGLPGSQANRREHLARRWNFASNHRRTTVADHAVPKRALLGLRCQPGPCAWPDADLFWSCSFVLLGRGDAAGTASPVF